MKTISPTPTGAERDSSLPSTTGGVHMNPWHSPLPYLFGGLAAMLGLIAFALLILVCSYWKFSDREESGESESRDLERGDGDEKVLESGKFEKVYEEKFLVIMAGEQNPTFLATPACAKSSYLREDDKTVANSEKRKEEEGGHFDEENPVS